MYQSVISRHDASLLTLNSEDATIVDTTYGNGKFTCQLKNANRGGTHAIKVVPNLVMVPNVFDNVTTGPGTPNRPISAPMNAFLGTGDFPWSIPTGYYTQSQFVTEFNKTTANFDDPVRRAIKMSVSENGFMQFFTTTGGAYTFEMTQLMANMLGFTWGTQTGSVIKLPTDHIYGMTIQINVPNFDPNTPNFDGNVTANVLPCMGTTPLVYVVTRQLAMNRMTASDSKEYNVIATVSMHDVPYGSYGVFRGGDIFMEDVEFRTPRALDQIDVELLDHKYRPLIVDTRYPVSIQLKVFHTDTVK
jgi:hypothetical protein